MAKPEEARVKEVKQKVTAVKEKLSSMTIKEEAMTDWQLTELEAGVVKLQECLDHIEPPKPPAEPVKSK